MAEEENLKDVDLYELLGILSTATTQEVKKAYRKTALSCHPDKNPDNPRAAQQFHQLSKALEILIDESARRAYDKVLNAKKAAKLRHRELDSKRQKLKEDLEARERLAEEAAKKYRSFDTRTDEEKLQAEIERLRKEGSKQVEEEQEKIRQQIKEEILSSRKKDEEDRSTDQNRLKLRWQATKDDPDNGGYNADNLHRMLSKYGIVVALLVSSKKKGSALVEFKTAEAAAMALELERGLASNPLRLESLETTGGREKPERKEASLGDLKSERSGVFPSVSSTARSTTHTNFPSFSFSPSLATHGPSEVSDSDFESVVLRRMRQAQERQKLIEQMMKEDDNEQAT